MGKRRNLSEQLNEYSKDDENLCGTNFAIHKNVMVWGGTIIQLSNISSIAQYNAWENREEEYSEQMERSVSFTEFKDKNPVYKYALGAAAGCLVIGLFVSFFLILAIGLAAWVGYSYFKQRKTTIDIPRTKTDRICHYMICITMNSTKKYDFEIKTEEFRSQVMLALYQRIVEPGYNAKDIQIDLKDCNIISNSTVNGGDVLLGNDNENTLVYADEDED